MTPAPLVLALQRLSDEDFERFVRSERKRRRQRMRLFSAEQHRWSPRRGLTRNDRVEVMRRADEGWSKS
jgi:hypothetical protein